MIEVNRDGEVWVYAEQQDGVLREVVLELCGKARELADHLGVAAGAVLAGSKLNGLPKQLIEYGIDNVYTVEDARLEHYQTGPFAHILSHAIHTSKPQIVLYGATPLGRDLAPRVASEVRAGMTADCTDLEIRDVTDPRAKQLHEKLLLQIRPAFGGNIIATIVNYDMWPQMATVREGVMALRDPNSARQGRVIPLTVDLGDELFALDLIARHIEPPTVNLKGARVIVAGGSDVRLDPVNCIEIKRALSQLALRRLQNVKIRRAFVHLTNRPLALASPNRLMRSAVTALVFAGGSARRVGWRKATHYAKSTIACRLSRS